ncbi:HK97 family phage prohead protease [Rubellimicrobium thermophilum]|nr:HK97 family phage prohead protease [Rubellimicrobium thermophilum]
MEGHASLWGIADRSGDIVERGAFAASLARLRAQGESVRMLWQHDPREVIGVWDEVTEDARGLHVRGRILPEVARGREALALLAAGALDGLSIGYRTLRATKDAQGRRRLHEIELWEVSLVTFPMLREARIASATGPAEALQELTAEIAAARARLRRA